MRRRGVRPQRSASEWVTRGLLTMIVAVAGYASVVPTLAYLLRAGDIGSAHVLAPGDGRITALLSQRLAGDGATASDRAQADLLARRALQQDATALPAAATLGANAQARGDTAGARRLFAYAQTLSRRDLQTHFWAIEDAVGRGDVASALRHYDIALRTSREAPAVLFPVLASAISDPAIRSALSRTLVGKPLWGDAFIDFVAGRGTDVRAIADLFLRLERTSIVPETAKSATVNRLISSGFPGDAWSYYAAIRPGARRDASRDPRFAADLASPSLLDWIPINDPGITTSIQRGDTGGVFDFAAPSSVGGRLLQQMQMLRPGTYRLQGHSAGIDQLAPARPYWLLSCSDGREIGRVDLPNSAQANGMFKGQFTVPAGCPLQLLTLVARPSDAIGGLTGQIDQVRLFSAAGGVEK